MNTKQVSPFNFDFKSLIFISLYRYIQTTGNVIPFRNVSWKTGLLFLSFIQCYVTPIVYVLLLTCGVDFAGQLDHMGWYALLLLVKFKPPSWFYFIKYSGWEHSVKIWWITRLKIHSHGCRKMSQFSHILYLYYSLIIYQHRFQRYSTTKMSNFG